MPARPPCLKVTFWTEHCSWLWATPWPAHLPHHAPHLLSSGPGGPSSAASPPPPPPSAPPLCSVWPRWPPCGQSLLLPCSVSHGVATPSLCSGKPPWCLKPSGTPRRVRWGSRVRVERDSNSGQRVWAAGIRGLLGDSTPPLLHAPYPPPAPLGLANTPQLTGMFVPGRSMRVSCGLGSHVRDRHRCREGGPALVSASSQKRPTPACTR